MQLKLRLTTNVTQTWNSGELVCSSPPLSSLRRPQRNGLVVNSNSHRPTTPPLLFSLHSSVACSSAHQNWNFNSLSLLIHSLSYSVYRYSLSHSVVHSLSLICSQPSRAFPLNFCHYYLCYHYACPAERSTLQEISRC
jgi:hypothetical protein